jgi:hypothetical protein
MVTEKPQITVTKKQKRLLDKALEIKNGAKCYSCPSCAGDISWHCKLCLGRGSVWILNYHQFGNLGQKIVEAIHVK